MNKLIDNKIIEQIKSLLESARHEVVILMVVGDLVK